jgi:rfaE bifunctional protein kinase chain/domain
MIAATVWPENERTHRLASAVERLAAARPRVLVIGDVMLDRYIHCEATDRDNPEWPGRKIRRFQSSQDQLGGAGAVAAMCAALGADVCLAGSVGNDPPGLAIRELLDEAGVEYRLTDVVSPVTTLKLRLVCGDLLDRIDRDAPSGMNGRPIGHHRDPWTWAAGLVAMGHVQAVLIADYAKGFCHVDELRKLLLTARMARVPTLVDPARGLRDWDCYRGAWLVKANLSEYRGLRGDARKSAWRAIRRIVVTAGPRGLYLRRGRRDFQAFHSAGRQVEDVCGAGDQVLATLGCATASGVDIEAACELAILAAGLSVTRRGATPIRLAELGGGIA